MILTTVSKYVTYGSYTQTEAGNHTTEIQIVSHHTVVTGTDITAPTFSFPKVKINNNQKSRLTTVFLHARRQTFFFCSFAGIEIVMLFVPPPRFVCVCVCVCVNRTPRDVTVVSELLFTDRRKNNRGVCLFE